jgi:hypothetical protein
MILYPAFCYCHTVTGNFILRKYSTGYRSYRTEGLARNVDPLRLKRAHAFHRGIPSVLEPERLLEDACEVLPQSVTRDVNILLIHTAGASKRSRKCGLSRRDHTSANWGTKWAGPVTVRINALFRFN